MKILDTWPAQSIEVNQDPSGRRPTQILIDGRQLTAEGGPEWDLVDAFNEGKLHWALYIVEPGATE